MPAFVFRLIGPRPTFMHDMTDDERAIMGAHAAYWRERMDAGQVVAFGPVADPAGPYGLGVVLADDQAEAEGFRDQDPAILSGRGFRTEIAPVVRLVTPSGTIES